MESNHPKQSYQYDAFISYSSQNEEFAIRLEKALRKHKPPKHLNVPQRHLKIFRDKPDLVGPEYFQAIEKALRSSSKLIVICSPEARRSHDVNDEIRRFVKVNGANNIITVLFSGRPNNEKSVQEHDKAFPEALCEVLERPRANDYRKFKLYKDKITAGEFEVSWYKILADIYNLLPSYIEQGEKEKQRRQRKIILGFSSCIIAVFLTFSAITLLQGNDPIKPTEKVDPLPQPHIDSLGPKISELEKLAKQQALIAESRSLAAEAWQDPKADPIWILNKAKQAAETAYTYEAEDALRRAIMNFSERMVLRGHTGDIFSASFNGDGSCIVTASVDGTARVWETSTGKAITLRGHKSAVMHACFSHDGSRIVTASSDSSARIWKAATGECLKILNGHEGMVQHAIFNSNDSLIVTASSDKTARVWGASTGKELKVLRGHLGSVNHVNFNHDDSRIVTCSSDNTAIVWVAATGKISVVLRGHTNMIKNASFNSNGSRLVTASLDSTARLWDANTGVELAKLHGYANHYIKHVSFNSNGSRILTASADRTARVWKAATGKEEALLKGHQDEVNYASFNDKGNRVATASNDKTARIWDTTTGDELKVLRGHTDVVNYANFNSDGSNIVTASSDGTVRIWDAQAGNELAALPEHGYDLNDAIISGNGNRIVTLSADGPARVWNTMTGKELATLRGHNGVNHVSINWDGSLVITMNSDGTAWVWKVATAETLVILRGHKGEVCQANFNRKGDRIVTASKDGTARVWDVATGKSLREFRQHKDEVYQASFNNNGSLIITASKDKTIRVWKTINGEEQKFWSSETGPVLSATFSAKGSDVIIVDNNGNAQVIDFTSARNTIIGKGLFSDINQARFNHNDSLIVTSNWIDKTQIFKTGDGKQFKVVTDPQGRSCVNNRGNRFIVASSEGEVQVWDMETLRPISNLHNHAGEVKFAAFSPDDRVVLIAGKDGTIRLHYTYSEDLIKLAKARLQSVETAEKSVN